MQTTMPVCLHANAELYAHTYDCSCLHRMQRTVRCAACVLLSCRSCTSGTCTPRRSHHCVPAARAGTTTATCSVSSCTVRSSSSSICSRSISSSSSGMEQQPQQQGCKTVLAKRTQWSISSWRLQKQPQMAPAGNAGAAPKKHSTAAACAGAAAAAAVEAIVA